MSEVLMDFARPLLEMARDAQDWEKIIMLAITAWNLSLLPEHERAKDFEKHFLPVLGPEGADIVSGLIERKLALFGGLRRFVMDYEVRSNSEGVSLNVISTPMQIGP